MRIPGITDTELAALAAAGDGDAFGELIERYAPPARRVTKAILADPHDADDAAQDGFLSAWRHLSRFDGTRPFGPWLMRIVINAAQDFRRRRVVRTTEPLPEDRAGGTETPEESTARAMLRKSLTEALAALPERQRLAVVLFDAEGYSHAEISKLLGVAEGTVRSDVFHARRTLRTALAAYAGEGR
jgi:RNA polymerase sigma-70 factor (ECF subfamily)